MKYTMAYVKETINYGITYYHRESLQLVDVVNYNYANGKDTQRLTNRYIFFVGEEPMSWSIKRQEIVIMLAIKSEYVAVLRAVLYDYYYSLIKYHFPRKNLLYCLSTTVVQLK